MMKGCIRTRLYTGCSERCLDPRSFPADDKLPLSSLRRGSLARATPARIGALREWADCENREDIVPEVVYCPGTGHAAHFDIVVVEGM